MASIFVANMIRYKKEGLPARARPHPGADRRRGTGLDFEVNGANWLVKNNRDLIDADFGLNEGGGGELKGGKPLFNRVQAGREGLSALPARSEEPGRPQLAAASGQRDLPTRRRTRGSANRLPGEAERDHPHLFSRSRAIPERASRRRHEAVARATPDPEAAARLSAKSPTYNSMLRTTCVATRLDGGHANNALPQQRPANVNCRILPGEPVEGVLKTIQQVVGDKVTVTRMSEPVPSAPSALRPDVMGRSRKSPVILARRPCDPGDEYRAADRLALHAQRRHPDLWRVGLVPRSGRQPLARAQRAHAGEVALRRP